MANIVFVYLLHDFRVGQGATAVPGIIELWHAAPFHLGPGSAIDQYVFAIVDALHQFFIAIQGVAPVLNGYLAGSLAN